MYSRNFSLFDPFLDVTLLIFFVVSLVSVFGSQYLSMSLQGVHKLVRYLLLFVAAREVVRHQKGLRWIVLGLMGGALVASLDGILQMIFGADPLRGRTVLLGFQNVVRITSSFPNPNPFAIYLSALIPLGYALARYGRYQRIFFAVLLSLMILCVGLTYARPAALALAINGFLLFILKKDFVIPLVGILVLLGILLWLPAGVREWVVQLGSVHDFLVDKGRYFHHEAAWNMIAHKPWWGLGLNTFDVHYQHFKETGDTFTRWSAHQGYLQMASETGLVGLASFLVVLFTIARFAWQGYQKAKDPFLRSCLLGFLGGFVSFLVAGFYESVFWQPRQTYFFWFWVGLMCGSAKLSESNEDSGVP